MDKYFIIPNPDFILSNGLVMATKWPYIMGNTMNYLDEDKRASFQAKKEKGYTTTVPGYNIVVTYVGNLEKADIPASVIEQTLQEMAQFYLEKKVNDKPGFYKRFKCSL